MKKQITKALWAKIYDYAGFIYMCEVDSLSYMYYGRLCGFESALCALEYDTTWLWLFITNLKL